MDISIVQGCVVEHHVHSKIELMDIRRFLSTRKLSYFTAFTLRTSFPLSSDTVSSPRTRVRLSFRTPSLDFPISRTSAMV